MGGSGKRKGPGGRFAHDDDGLGYFAVLVALDPTEAQRLASEIRESAQQLRNKFRGS